MASVYKSVWALMSSVQGNPRLVGDEAAYTYEVGSMAAGSQTWNATFSVHIDVRDPDNGGKLKYSLKRNPSIVVHG